MKRLDFLKQSLVWKCYQKTAWMISAFSLIKESEEAWKADMYPGRIVQNPWGYSFVSDQGELVKIDDAKPGVPLFAMMEEISIDPSWIVNLKAPTNTLVGTLFANQLLLADNYGSKIDFIPEDVSIKKIESYIIKNRA